VGCITGTGELRMLIKIKQEDMKTNVCLRGLGVGVKEYISLRETG
jgi:hypothetical protein